MGSGKGKTQSRVTIEVFPEKEIAVHALNKSPKKEEVS